MEFPIPLIIGLGIIILAFVLFIGFLLVISCIWHLLKLAYRFANKSIVYSIFILLLMSVGGYFGSIVFYDMGIKHAPVLMAILGCLCGTVLGICAATLTLIFICAWHYLCYDDDTVLW